MDLQQHYEQVHQQWLMEQQQQEHNQQLYAQHLQQQNPGRTTPDLHRKRGLANESDEFMGIKVCIFIVSCVNKENRIRVNEVPCTCAKNTLGGCCNDKHRAKYCERVVCLRGSGVVKLNALFLFLIPPIPFCATLSSPTSPFDALLMFRNAIWALRQRLKGSLAFRKQEQIALDRSCRQKEEHKHRWATLTSSHTFLAPPRQRPVLIKVSDSIISNRCSRPTPLRPPHLQPVLTAAVVNLRCPGHRAVRRSGVLWHKARIPARPPQV